MTKRESQSVRHSLSFRFAFRPTVWQWEFIAAWLLFWLLSLLFRSLFFSLLAVGFCRLLNFRFGVVFFVPVVRSAAVGHLFMLEETFLFCYQKIWAKSKSAERHEINEVNDNNHDNQSTVTNIAEFIITDIKIKESTTNRVRKKGKEHWCQCFGVKGLHCTDEGW